MALGGSHDLGPWNEVPCVNPPMLTPEYVAWGYDDLGPIAALYLEHLLVSLDEYGGGLLSNDLAVLGHGCHKRPLPTPPPVKERLGPSGSLALE